MTQANHPNHHHAVDIHAHYFPQPFLDLIAANAGAYGFEHRMIEGKGPQFKIGHLTTGPVGRKFEFVLQELNREANTLTVKCNHPRVSALVVDIKAELEKLREQIQNVE